MVLGTRYWGTSSGAQIDVTRKPRTLERIHAALEAAREVLNSFTPGAIETEYKVGHDPVTEADRAVDAFSAKRFWPRRRLALGRNRRRLHPPQQAARLVVDSARCTREFVQALPGFCVSIAMVENGIPVAVAAIRPPTNSSLGSPTPASLQRPTRAAQPAQNSPRSLVLASRSEVKRGEWKHSSPPNSTFAPWAPSLQTRLVAAGRADLTFTLVPKNDGTSRRSRVGPKRGGWTLKLETLRACNQNDPLISGLLAGGPFLRDPTTSAARRHSQPSPPTASPSALSPRFASKLLSS